MSSCIDIGYEIFDKWVKSTRHVKIFVMLFVLEFIP
jgi:hypothetical protein